jgi:hypothetical protein
MSLFRDLLESGYRSVAMKRHPDRGGNTADMQRLNDLMEELRGQV